MQSLIDLLKQYKLQFGLIGVSTIVYQVIKNFKQSGSGKGSEQEKVNMRSRLIRRKTILFTQARRDRGDYQIPKELTASDNPLVDEIKFMNSPMCKIQKVPHLVNELGLNHYTHIKSPLWGENKYRCVYGGKGFLPSEAFVYRGSFVLSKNTYSKAQQLANPTCWLLAGPRRNLHFKPTEVRAAIVTCGGLCPGLNVVIRQIYVALNILYGCPQVWGIKYGYLGIYTTQWIRLTFDIVRNLQYDGGTFLGSSRGDFNGQKILQALIKNKINQLYVIGGDGTHRGILELSKMIRQRKLQISVVGVPKTIDNDIPLIDKSFGFETAVEQSIRAIRSAYVESIGVNHGIGLVRLMGRNAGFIAMEATNASRDVDICLIPQFPFDLYKQFGVFEYIVKELQIKKHMVIVVAEGAGFGARDEQRLQEIKEKDKSLNSKPVDVGEFLKKQIVSYCKSKGLDATLKYIDPAYMIRTVPANSYDRRMCAYLAASAVHGAMAGFTGFTVGLINNSPVMIPITSLKDPSRVTKQNRAWQRLLGGTGQPSFLNQNA